MIVTNKSCKLKEEEEAGKNEEHLKYEINLKLGVPIRLHWIMLFLVRICLFC